MGKLENKIALVTGAASGIGQGIAIAFAREGGDVIVVDRKEESLAIETIEGIIAYGRRALFIQADLGDETSVSSMAAQALHHFGRVDILVNNAGVFSEVLLENMSAAQWDQSISTNLRSVFLCTRYLIGQMLERGDGRIINMASQLAYNGGTSATHYTASKAGVIGFTKALAREVSSRGVLVNAIAPGPIETPMPVTEDWHRTKVAELPIGRLGRVDEITPTAILLASEGGSYYVGATLGPNGGDVMV